MPDLDAWNNDMTQAPTDDGARAVLRYTGKFGLTVRAAKFSRKAGCFVTAAGVHLKGERAPTAWKPLMQFPKVSARC